jgi:hypothetical protein
MCHALLLTRSASAKKSLPVTFAHALNTSLKKIWFSLEQDLKDKKMIDEASFRFDSLLCIRAGYWFTVVLVAFTAYLIYLPIQP